MKYFLILILILSGMHVHAQEFDSTMVFPFKSGNKWTFRNQADILSQAPFFDSILVGSEPYYFGFFKGIVKNKNRYGVVEYKGKCDTLIPVEYNALMEVSPDCYLLRKDNLWKTFFIQRWDNRKGKMVWQFEELGKLDSFYVENEVAYFWKSGKVSLKRGSAKTFNSNYPFVRIFDRSIFNQGYQHRLKPDNNRNEENDPELVYLVSDGKHFGLVRGSKELIPCVAESVQPYNRLFCRFWNGSYWKYVRYKDGFTIDPSGGTVVFYRNDCWKIYSTDRKKGVLYFNGTPYPIKGFEDYFLLSDNYIAVRKDGKIGMLNKKGVVLIRPIYEQIDFLMDSHLRVLKDGKWYLSNEDGTLLSKSGYDFIGRISDWIGGKTIFEIHEKGKVGAILKNGNVLLSPNYSSIAFLDDYVLAEKDDVITVLGKNGKKLAEKNYVGYNLENHFLIMYLDDHQKDVFSVNGKLNQFPFTQMADLGGVLKLYGGKELEVLVMNPQRTVVEERQLYAGVASFNVAGFDQKNLRFGLSDIFDLSYLEEHQLSGFFGYRKTFDTTHIMKPDYLECYNYGIFNWEIGIRTYEKKQIKTSDGLIMSSLFDFQIIKSESAKVFTDLMNYTTFNDEMNGYTIKSETTIMAYSLEKGNFWLHGQQHKASEIREIDYRGYGTFAYYLGGQYESSSRDDRLSISNYDRYLKMNHTFNLSPENEGVLQIMNPKSYKKLQGGKWFVTLVSNLQKKQNDALINRYYTEFSYLDGVDYSNPTFIARGNSDNWIWNYQEGDSVANTSYTRVEPMNELMLVEVNGKKGICLPNREVILEAVYDELFVLSWDLLMVRKEEKHGLVDFNGNWIVPLNE